MSSRTFASIYGSCFLGLLAVNAAACKQSKLPAPPAEAQKADVKVDLPAVPAFDLPSVNADGSHSVKEMRVRGRKMLGKETMIKGYVTWAYDCATAIRQPGWTDEDVAKAIAEDQSKCERPKFYLGDSADTPAEKSIWVVDVPRAPTETEVKNLPKEEIKNWPAVPPYKVGDEIVVRGQWVQSSPHSEKNNEGLLVYTWLRNNTQNWETPPPGAPVEGAAPAATKAAPKH